MFRHHLAWIAVPALLGLGGCIREETAPPRAAQVIVQPARPTAPAVAPGPPPPPHSELVPPPPQGVGPGVWHPGHWLLSGNDWVWQPGEYVSPPPGETTWVPGGWMQQPGGGWVWLDGHWA
jgi:hypothetical protein